MNKKNFIGKEVTHKRLGTGEIIGFDDKRKHRYIVIRFENCPISDCRLVFPDALLREEFFD